MKSSPEPRDPATDATVRSGGMLRLGRWAAVTGVVVGVLTLGACGHRGWSHGDDPAERVEHMVDRVFSKVDATDEQKARIGEIATAAWKELAPMREQWRESRSQAVVALTGEKVDRARLETLRTEQLAALQARSATLTTALADIAEVLTPEQRAQARERLERRADKHHGW